jgi:hypothetical protein
MVVAMPVGGIMYFQSMEMKIADVVRRTRVSAVPASLLHATPISIGNYGRYEYSA